MTGGGQAAEAACALGREYLVRGELEAAIADLEKAVEFVAADCRGEAAFLLGVAYSAHGDDDAGRKAFRVAMETDAEAYAVPAAYCLAASYEREDDVAAAREGWQAVAEAETVYYRPPALFALANGYARDGDDDRAWTLLMSTYSTSDPQYAVKAAIKLARMLLEQGKVDAARDLLAAALIGRDDSPGRGVADERTSREQTTLSLRAMLESRQPKLVVAAAYGMARAEGWLADGEPSATPAEFTEDMPQVGAWWERYVSDAASHGTLPHLAWELFAAIDGIYRHVAVPYALGVETYDDPDEVMTALGEAVRLPSDYAWGQSLHDRFRADLQTALGADRPLLPEDWPARRVPHEDD